MQIGISEEMASLRTLRVDTDGAQLEVRDRGEGEPVVFSHGSMPDECAAVVKEPALVKHFRVIDYHRRGWGGSSRAIGPVSIGQNVEDAGGFCGICESNGRTSPVSPRAARSSRSWRSMLPTW
jgi:pimeloyl-ACP methyl ester carboxylesterase